MTSAPQVDLVDAHVHVWDRARHPQPWIDPVAMAAIDRDFDLQALRDDVENAQPPRVVLVQAVPSESETRDLLETALTDPLVAGVVGWVDLTGATVADRLAALLAADGGRWLVGVRHLLQDETDPAWLDRPDAHRGAQLVADAGLSLDLVIRHEQLPAVARLAQAVPGLRLVLDHLGKPAIATGELEPWRTDLFALAREPNTAVKLSGLVTEARWSSWATEQLAPYSRAALDAFRTVPRDVRLGLAGRAVGHHLPALARHCPGTDRGSQCPRAGRSVRGHGRDGLSTRRRSVTIW